MGPRLVEQAGQSGEVVAESCVHGTTVGGLCVSGPGPITETGPVSGMPLGRAAVPLREAASARRRHRKRCAPLPSRKVAQGGAVASWVAR
ncbi:hypothetical protein GCM10014719_20820 [Planomonospora parontospora subsp. antibiotica]|nr:hypothetical protein GCM10014719_20820 [Planomonospora parontospora subsp. antibiotica]GII15542.1 hypothetical protein Ppa05_22680 [Planomonospora parontospora subsp. antibiotica]